MKKKSRRLMKKEAKFNDEEMEWIKLKPSKRILETTKLWQLYISLGGSLDPEPDPQSPFYPQTI